MSLTRRIAHNTIMQFASKIVGTALGLLTISAMTRYLGQAGFGYYSIIMGFLLFFGILVDFGLTLTTAQMLGKANQTKGAGGWDADTLFANILGLRVVSALLFLGLAPLAVLLFPYPPIVKIGIAVGTVSFFFLALNQIFLGYYQARLEMQWVSLAEIANRVFLLAAVLYIIRFDLGLITLIGAISLSNVVQFLCLYLPARRLSSIRLGFSLACWRDIWSATWPIALSIALNLLYLKTDILILSVYRLPEEVGLYGAAYKVVDVLTMFPVLFAGLILPLLTRYWHAGEQERFRRLVQQGFDAMSIIAWPMMVGTLFVGGDMMALVAGEPFRASGLILNLLIWASGVIFLNAVFAHAIVAIDKQKQSIFAYGVAAVLGLSGYFLFIPRFGAMGAAAMTIATETCVAILVFLVYAKHTRQLPSLRRFPAITVSCLVMAAVLWLTAPWPFVARLLVAIVTYSLTMLVTKGISRSFVADLVSLKKYEA